MNVHPLIEAEKQQGHNVKRACELLKVSRTACYARRNPAIGLRRARDLELIQEIAAVHAQSYGTYGVRASTRSCSARANTDHAPEAFTLRGVTRRCQTVFLALACAAMREVAAAR